MVTSAAKTGLEQRKSTYHSCTIFSASTLSFLQHASLSPCHHCYQLSEISSVQIEVCGSRCWCRSNVSPIQSACAGVMSPWWWGRRRRVIWLTKIYSSLFSTLTNVQSTRRNSSSTDRTLTSPISSRCRTCSGISHLSWVTVTCYMSQLNNWFWSFLIHCYSARQSWSVNLVLSVNSRSVVCLFVCPQHN